MSDTRRDDQAGDSLSYLGRDGGLQPLEGGDAGPQFVPTVQRNPIKAYRCVRKTSAAGGPGNIEDYGDWRVGALQICEEQQVPAEAYDIGESIDVSQVNSVTWFIDYVPPFQTGDDPPPDYDIAHVLSVIMEVSHGGARWRPYTVLDNAFTQNNLRGNASQPEPVGVGSYFATRYAYSAEFRSPNTAAADLPAPPRPIDRRIDQPEFELDPNNPETPPGELTQNAPIGFHLTFDVSPFTAVRLRWKHLQVDTEGAYVEDGLVDPEDPQNPETNGFVTIHYSLVSGG